MRALLVVLECSTLLILVHASCFIHNAKWEKGGPRVTQTSKTDASKVLVDWSSIIKNQKCADKYYLWVWKEGQQKAQGKKYVIADKNTLTKNVDIEPCVFHNFRVELEEDDATKTDAKDSDTTRYNSAALPLFNSTEVVSQFRVSYYQDPRTLQFDLTKVSLRFPARFLTFASCLKHMEVTGKVAAADAQKAGSAATTTTTTTSTTTTTVATPAVAEDFISPRFGGWEPYGTGRNPGEMGAPPKRGWGSGGYNSGSGSGQGGYNPGSGSYNPGYGGSGSGTGGYNPGYGDSGSGLGSYNPGYGGSGSGSSQGGYNPGAGSGQGSGGYNPGTTTTTWRPPTTTWRPSPTTTPWGYNPGGRPPTDRPGGGWSYTTTGRPAFVSTTTTSRPGFGGGYNPGGYNPGGYNPGSYNPGGYNPGWGGRSAFSNQFLKMSKRPSAQLAGPVKAVPPFLTEEVEVVVPLPQPCEHYVFEVKMLSPANSELGVISGIKLAALPDLPDYIPPPITAVVQVDFIGGGKHTVSTQKTSPVPESCLPDYMEALDAYANRLETLGNQQKSVVDGAKKRQGGAQQSVEVTQAEILARHGCLCASPRLELAYTDLTPGTPVSYDAVKAKHKSPVFGVYLYDGMREGRPFYRLDLERRSTGEFVTRLVPAAQPSAPPPVRRRKRFIGRVDGGPSTTTKLPWNYGAAGGGWGNSPTTAGYYSGGGWATPTTTSWPPLPGVADGYPGYSAGGQQPQPPISKPGGGGGVSFPKDPVTTTIIPIIRESSSLPPTAAGPALVPRYIYWDATSKQWLISTQVGAKDTAAEFGSGFNTKAACPADLASEVWQTRTDSLRSGTGRWVEEPAVKLLCSPAY